MYVCTYVCMNERTNEWISATFTLPMHWCMNGATQSQFIATSGQTHSWDIGKQFSLYADCSKAQEQQLCLGRSWKRQSQDPSEAWVEILRTFRITPWCFFPFPFPGPSAKELKAEALPPWGLSAVPECFPRDCDATLVKRALQTCQDIQPICSDLIVSTESTV